MALHHICLFCIPCSSLLCFYSTSFSNGTANGGKNTAAKAVIFPKTVWTADQSASTVAWVSSQLLLPLELVLLRCSDAAQNEERPELMSRVLMKVQCPIRQTKSILTLPIMAGGGDCLRLVPLAEQL